jgi:hypothetical protein
MPGAALVEFAATVAVLWAGVLAVVRALKLAGGARCAGLHVGETTPSPRACPLRARNRGNRGRLQDDSRTRAAQVSPLCITWTSTSLAATVVRRGRARPFRYVYACGAVVGVVGMFAAVALVAGNLGSNSLHLASRIHGYLCECALRGTALALRHVGQGLRGCPLHAGPLQTLLARPAREVQMSELDPSSTVRTSTETQEQTAGCKSPCGM